MRRPEPQNRSQQHYLSDLSLSSHTSRTVFSHTSEGFLPSPAPWLRSQQSHLLTSLCVNGLWFVGFNHCFLSRSSGKKSHEHWLRSLHHHLLCFWCNSQPMLTVLQEKFNCYFRGTSTELEKFPFSPALAQCTTEPYPHFPWPPWFPLLFVKGNPHACKDLHMMI